MCMDMDGCIPRYGRTNELSPHTTVSIPLLITDRECCVFRYTDKAERFLFMTCKGTFNMSGNAT